MIELKKHYSVFLPYHVTKGEEVLGRFNSVFTAAVFMWAKKQEKDINT